MAETPACTRHWLDGVVRATGFTPEASSSSAVVAHGAAATETVASIHAVVTAIVVAIHEAIAASVVPSSGRICESGRGWGLFNTHALERSSDGL